MASKKVDDLQHFLPAELQTRWAVLPKYALYQLFIVGVLLGGAVTLTVLGIYYRNKTLGVIAGCSITGMYVQNWLFKPMHNRYESEARRHSEKIAG